MAAMSTREFSEPAGKGDVVGSWREVLLAFLRLGLDISHLAKGSSIQIPVHPKDDANWPIRRPGA
jgi:hypothetical protein